MSIKIEYAIAWNGVKMLPIYAIFKTEKHWNGSKQEPVLWIR